MPVLQGTREVAGQEVADLSGGIFAMGSAYFGETPRWQPVSPFSIGTTTIPESRYREVMGRPGRAEAPEDHPVMNVSWWRGFADYFKKVNERIGRPVVGFPTPEEWECAGRGPAVNVRDLMEKEGIKPRGLPDAADEWLENFFMEPGGTRSIRI